MGLGFLSLQSWSGSLMVWVALYQLGRIVANPRVSQSLGPEKKDVRCLVNGRGINAFS